MKLQECKSILKNQIIDNNPIFVQVLGMCPTLAVTTSLVNGIGMGLAATFVLIFSNLVISILRRIIPKEIRIASYVVIIAGFVSIIEMVMKAYLPDVSKSLGLFIPLIVVNCIILARAESYASKNTFGRSALDGFATGIGFTFALMIISSIREILGNGTILNFHLFGEGFQPAILMILPAGGFITLGVVIALVNFIKEKKSGGKK